MSGVELYLSVLGVVIPALQAAIAAKDRATMPTAPRVHAKDIAELHNNAGQELFSAIYANLQVYQEVVEPNVDEKDRAFASQVQRCIYRTIQKSQQTAQELDSASKDKRSKAEDLRALESKLEEHAKYLNSFQLQLMHRLSIRQFQQLSSNVDLQSPTAQSENPAIAVMSDIEPIKVSYGGDPQLDWPISKGDTALLRDLFDGQENNTEPTSRPSLALLLACRERLPKIVKLCLDYAADPTVTGEDGLGTIHNAIGTADVVDEPPETIEILTLLIDQGVEASARDSTKERLRPLHRAAMTKNIGVTKFLLENKPAMVNLVDAEERTALYQACATPNQKLALIKELVDRNADFAGKLRPRMPDCDGQIIARYLDEKGLK